MLEDFRLKVFVTVARTKSFTEAARQLNISQPAASQNIAELEKGLGVKLFERLHGETVLTMSGEVLMRYAERLLSAGKAAESLFARLPSAVIRIAASEEVHTYLIEPALEEFSAVHPEITFERVIFGDCDLKVSIRPSSGMPYDVDEDVIAKCRVSMWAAPKKMGGVSATHEKSSYFDILFKPSQAFALTKTCRLLKDYFASLL